MTIGNATQKSPAFIEPLLPRYVEGSTLYEGSVRNFYSPFESPDASDDEDEVKEPPPLFKK